MSFRHIVGLRFSHFCFVIFSLDRNIHYATLGYAPIDQNVTRGSQELNPAFPLGAVIQYFLIQCLQVIL